MATSPQRSIKSRASLAGHPLHPVMIHFPVAALMALVASDLAYWYTGDPFWVRSGLWLAGVGAFGGWFASIAGIIDLVSVSRIRRLITGWSHAIVAVVMLSLASLNWLLRLNSPEAILPWGLAVSLVTGALIALAGWLGGQLVYEHAVGVDVDD
ncbi:MULTISPECIES: DUF2231 domain-containing protein [unclassified Halomonas]|uniref:DUF2231 domain-containing protein n=1 Tax=unclassified Halomonas TaxID=2609666 RepID=UPI00209EE934|nr:MULTISPECIES: DUF2231 domain-containing protein [unclassified Halomonas]MCP1315530.1 DUF2231 domain-containing protein [Halomonas sp. 707D7]MCP1326728.1 DUF2231 domain-containing protein [Halomonas sp. 707D4]